jgi:acetyl-CoA carboxylase carboxyltransferase component
VTFVDVPGFLCGVQQESAGIISHGAKLLYAYGEATVPKVTVTFRKSFGGAHITMACKQLGGDVNFAWPSADIAVMGADGAVGILYAKELASVDDPAARQELSSRLKQEYQDKYCSLRSAADQGYIDEIIRPEDTRSKVISALRSISVANAETPWKKHDNLPL